MDRLLNIFFDIDETLVCAVRYSRYLESEVKAKGFKCCMYGRYLIILRQHAPDMLAYARLRGNTYALTQGRSEYFFAINRDLGLGFNSETGYTCGDIAEFGGKHGRQKGLPKFKDQKNILIDNLTYPEQVNFPNDYFGYGSKIDFLHDLPTHHYFNIRDFRWPANFDKELLECERVQKWIESFVD